MGSRPRRRGAAVGMMASSVLAIQHLRPINRQGGEVAKSKDPIEVLPYVLGIGPAEPNVSITPVRPLWDGATSRLMPSITFGSRLRGAFAFMGPDEASRILKEALDLYRKLRRGELGRK